MPHTLDIRRPQPHVAEVWLNRPDVRNAFNDGVIAELTHAFAELGADPDLRAIVLGGHGKAFCAGADLAWMRAMADYSWEQNHADAGALAQMLWTVWSCPLPVVGRIHGDCYAGGVGLAAVCDVLVAADGMHFCLSEARLGLLPGTIAPYVVRALGEQAARRLFVTAERFGAGTGARARLRPRGRSARCAGRGGRRRRRRGRRQRPGRGEGVQAAGEGRRRRSHHRGLARRQRASHRRHPRQRRGARRRVGLPGQARPVLAQLKRVQQLMRVAAAVTGALLMNAPVQAAVDLNALWDFSQPALSEQRFRAALADADRRGNRDDALILQTQIARTHGLRKDFDTARVLLRALEPQLHDAGAEARVHWFLEWGRAHASATHAPGQLNADAKATARAAFQSALDAANGAQLDGLAIDAIHMAAFVDTEPVDQLRWGQQALAIATRSKQPAAQRWEAAIRHNIGHALHQLGRHGEALAQFQLAVPLREAAGKPEPLRVAHWMVARTLRALQRDDEALAIQLRLERECDAAGEPDPYVFEELETLYRVCGDDVQAQRYADRRAGAQQPPAAK